MATYMNNHSELNKNIFSREQKETMLVQNAPTRTRVYVMNKPGRPLHPIWKDNFHLESSSDNKKYAKCLICGKMFSSIAPTRLIRHRENCQQSMQTYDYLEHTLVEGSNVNTNNFSIGSIDAAKTLLTLSSSSKSDKTFNKEANEFVDKNNKQHIASCSVTLSDDNISNRPTSSKKRKISEMEMEIDDVKEEKPLPKHFEDYRIDEIDLNIIDTQTKEQVKIVIKEFKQPHLKQLLIARGGEPYNIEVNTIQLFRDACSILLNNWLHMKIVATDNKPRISPEVVKLINDEEFIENVDLYQKILNDVFQFTENLIKENYNIADWAKLWLNLKIPNEFVPLTNYKSKMMNEKALVAHFFHPLYRGKELGKEQNAIVHKYLIDNLTADGLDEFAEFLNKEGVFEKLFTKNITNPSTFWTVSEGFYPGLSKLVLDSFDGFDLALKS